MFIFTCHLKSIRNSIEIQDPEIQGRPVPWDVILLLNGVAKQCTSMNDTQMFLKHGMDPV